VSEFERHLEGELQLLKTGRSEGLEAIAVAKQALVEKINSEESMFADLFQQYGSDEEVIDLKNRLAQCRVNNRNNHALVMMELKHANKSLELLRSVLNMDDLSLYSDRGEVQVNREKRRFGSA
jgi:flagellar biosynthesis/type III secretory pathway chaperone